MPEPTAVPEESLSLEMELHIDAVCQSFEAAWKAGDGRQARPRLEDLHARLVADYLASP
jgi:hypothetical protein